MVQDLRVQAFALGLGFWALGFKDQNAGVHGFRLFDLGFSGSRWLLGARVLGWEIMPETIPASPGGSYLSFSF